MADSIKFTNKYIDCTGVWDSTLSKTQQAINAQKLDIANIVNNFTTTTTGTYALDAAAGKTLNDSITSLTTNLIHIKQQTIPISNATLSSHSKATVLNWGQVAGSYIPGHTLVGAVYLWGSGGYTFSGNCQVNSEDGTVYLEVYNPHTSSVTLTNIILLLFYH